MYNPIVGLHVSAFGHYQVTICPDSNAVPFQALLLRLPLIVAMYC